MQTYNNLNKREKYIILVRKLKEGFISFTDDLLEVFPKCKNLFLQRIIAYQLPDTALYKILKNNIDNPFISINDEFYLQHKLCLIKGYELYLNENVKVNECFTFNDIYQNENYKISINDNIEMIWKWL